MKFLCDVHIPFRLNNYLKSLDHHSVHINEVLNKWYTKDDVICSFADEQGFIVITKDGDFKNSFLLKGTPKKLIKINLGNINTTVLIQLFSKHLKAIEYLYRTEKNFMLEMQIQNTSFITKD